MPRFGLGGHGRFVARLLGFRKLPKYVVNKGATQSVGDLDHDFGHLDEEGVLEKLHCFLELDFLENDNDHNAVPKHDSITHGEKQNVRHHQRPVEVALLKLALDLVEREQNRPDGDCPKDRNYVN